MLPKLLVVIAQNSLREQKGTYPWLFVTDGRGVGWLKRLMTDKREREKENDTSAIT